MKFFKEIQMNGILHPIFKKTQPVMMRKRNMTSGRSQENSFIVITLYQESNCTCREKKLSYSDEVHRRYQNNIYVTGRNDGEKYLRLLERGW